MRGWLRAQHAKPSFARVWFFCLVVFGFSVFYWACCLPQRLCSVHANPIRAFTLWVQSTNSAAAMDTSKTLSNARQWNCG